MAELIAELMQLMSLHPLEVETAHTVDVTHINDPHDFYARPKPFAFYLPVLQAPGRIFKASNIKPGVRIIFKSTIAHTYVRGHVRAIERNADGCSYIIFAPDYGFIEKGVIPAHVFTPYKDFPVPPLAAKCKLAHCKPIGSSFSDKAIDAMKYYIGEEKAKLIVKIKLPDVLVVDLHNSMPDDVATLLAITGYTNLGVSVDNASCVPPARRLYYQYRDIKEGDKMLVRVLCGKSFSEFYVADITDYKKYTEGLADFNYCCKREPQLTIDEFKVGQPVAVKDEFGQFERGTIKEITVPDKKAIVQYIDVGKLKEAHIMWMKPLKTEFYFQRAASALYCGAEQTQVNDNRLDKFLHPGSKVMVSVKKVGKHFEEPHIVTILPKITQ